MTQRIVYWFRNDLRLHDNEALTAATLAAKEIIPVYVFDPRLFKQTKLGFKRTGALRAQFLIDSVIDLRNRLREKGADLLIRIGEPEKVVAELAELHQAQYIYTSKEIAPEETRIESSLSKNLKIYNIDIKLFWMNTLNAVTALPFPICKLPMGFDHYRNLIQPTLQVNQPLPEPADIVLPQEYEAGNMVSLPMLDIDPLEIARLKTNDLPKGGETTAIAQLHAYVQDHQRRQINTVDSLTDSLLTNWLSLGNLSIRTLYHTLNKKVSHQETLEHLIQNILERDYFNWTLLRYGPRIFKSSGVQHSFEQTWLADKVQFSNWISGKTGNEDINRIMEKVMDTGQISSFERKQAAAYLTQNEKINWTWGAMYFESFLTDYSVSVNWGKWNNLAGVGAN